MLQNIQNIVKSNNYKILYEYNFTFCGLLKKPSWFYGLLEIPRWALDLYPMTANTIDKLRTLLQDYQKSFNNGAGE